MEKTGRNDPCPCGSGKKYKQCCLKAQETQSAQERTQAAPRALKWLMTMHSQAVHRALDEAFFAGLAEEQHARLHELERENFDGIMANALEWLLADGIIQVKGQEWRVADLVLGRGCPLFSVEQRQWLDLLAAHPLRLFEVIDVTPGESMLLKDAILAERAPVRVQERAGSRQVLPFDLIGARVLPVADHFELSGAIYSIPRHRSQGLIEELQEELTGVDPDSPEAREILSTIIPHHWVMLFVAPFEMPTLVDHVTGQPILLITDHYRVQDWDTLESALSGETDIDGNRQHGWSRLFQGHDGLMRSSLTVETGSGADRLKVCYRTKDFAEQGRPWFEAVAGGSVTFLSRELSDPKGLLANLPGGKATPASIAAPLPPEAMTAVLEKSIRNLWPTSRCRRCRGARRAMRSRPRKVWNRCSSCCILMKTPKHGRPGNNSETRCPMTSSGRSLESVGSEPPASHHSTHRGDSDEQTDRLVPGHFSLRSLTRV